MLEINNMRAETDPDTMETTISTDRLWVPATLPRIGLLFALLWRGKLYGVITAKDIEEARAVAAGQGKAEAMGWRVLPARLSWVAQ